MVNATMALRNTLRQPHRTILLGGAIALGVAIICLVNGFTAGMEKSVQANVTLFSAGHVLVNGITASESGRAQSRITDETLEGKVKELLPEAVSVSKTAQVQATVVFGSREQQLRLRGVDWKQDALFSENLVLTGGDWEGAKRDRMIILGAQSARRFGLGLGDSVMARFSTVSGQQNVTEYKLGAIYDDAAAGGMSTALVPLDDLLSDLNMKEGQYQALAVFLADAMEADGAARKLEAGLGKEGFRMLTAETIAGMSARRIAAPTTTGAGAAAAIAGALGGAMGGGAGMGGRASGMSFLGFINLPAGSSYYRVSTITELSGQMSAVLGTVRWIGITIFIVMLILTAAGISNTYRLVLMERVSEIGMLRCIGFRRSDVFRIFIFEAIFIALGGSLAGIFVSLPAGALVHLIRLNPSGALGSALSGGHLVFAPSVLSLLAVILCVAAASVIAVYYPAKIGRAHV